MSTTVGWMPAAIEASDERSMIGAAPRGLFWVVVCSGDSAPSSSR